MNICPSYEFDCLSSKPEKYIWNKVIDDFQMMYYCQINGHTQVNTDSGNGLMSDGTKPSPKQCWLGVIGIQPSASSPNDHMLEKK